MSQYLFKSQGINFSGSCVYLYVFHGFVAIIKPSVSYFNTIGGYIMVNLVLRIGLLSGVALLLFIFGCRPRKPVDEPAATQNLIIYGVIDTVMLCDDFGSIGRTLPVVDRYINIPSDLSLEEKVSLLLDSLSLISFNGLDIEVLSLKQTPDGQTLLQVNLQENETFSGPGSLPSYQSWFGYFQGSTGGLHTSIILRETILQPDYTGPGDWIDAVEFFYMGSPIVKYTWDHITLWGRITQARIQ
ncbi:MAG TPA: hypothetical protein VLH61_08145 [Bacteroidales bacterium]|nr:hypothetical protein [Bacteroidales bacterium]